MVQDGVWAQMKQDGTLYFVITKFEDESFQGVVNNLQHSSTITWRNIPSKFKSKAEITSLRSWKKTKFEDNGEITETTLSALMPKTPGSWAKWLQNINNRDDRFWARGDNKKLKIKLIREVVGTDQNKLNEFWSDLVKTGDHDLIADAYKHMDKTQRAILQNSFSERIELLDKQITELKAQDPQNDASKIELARYEIKYAEIAESSKIFQAGSKQTHPKKEVVEEHQEHLGI